MKKKLLLILTLLVAAVATMSAQTKTETPVIYYELAEANVAAVYIYDDDPEAEIYFSYRYYDGDWSDWLEWMVYTEPVQFLSGVYLVSAYAISPDKDTSDISELCFEVPARVVIVEGAYVYADGVDDENGLQVHICSDPSYGYDFMLGEVVVDGFKYQINHSGEWLQYDSTIYLPEYGDYEIEAYGYAAGYGGSTTATAWIHYDADGYTSYSQPRDDYYQYLVHNDVVYDILNDSTVRVHARDYPPTSPFFALPHSARGDIVIPATLDWDGKTYVVEGIGKNAFNPVGLMSEESETTSITIPNTVTYIDDGAFAGCSLLTSIVIPDAVTAIKSNTFSGCYSLTSVIIPDAVTSIGDGSFYGCRALTNITLPNAVTSIGDWAFSDCAGLTSITIPNAVATIGNRCFSNCGSLTRIEVENDNPIYDSRDNCNAIIETASNTLIFGCMNTLIPNTLSAINEYAFWGCSGLVKLTIPDAVTSIGDWAFYGCSSLSKVSFGEAVTSIGELIFHSCNSLTNIICRSTTPATVTKNTFNGYSCDIYTQATLFVPNESLEAYRAHDVWGQFSRIVPFIGGGPGDVNGDGNIGVADVTNLIDMILSSDDLPAYADVDGNGKVDISDIVELIDMILRGY